MNGRGVVILPTYNEAENLPLMVEQVLAHSLDVMVVDDGSPDGTGDIAEGLKRESGGRVQAFHRPGKMGLGGAYLLGFKQALTAGFDFIFEMDCDFSHDPDDLPRLLGQAAGADLVLGSRYVAGGGTINWNVFRQLISRSGSLYAKLILGLPYQDLTGGFKCFRRGVLEALDLDSVRSNGYAFQIELTYRAHQRGFRIVEMPIVFKERRLGTSKMSKDIVTEAAAMVWRLKFSAK
ncbi:MAG: polyprenol monophosphomannose synthase [Chloroflexota bacterium]|nr:polyprenol monophosphomannose synthase [Chloroflexota bacterium]